MTENEKRALRDAFGAFPTGVTVVTTRQPDGTPRGFTANSFTSVSLDPPMILICIAKSAHSCDIFAQAHHFTVNILSDRQKEVSGLFASREADKFEQTNWHVGHANMPLLDGSLVGFVCRRDKVIDAGDHIVLIGKIEAFDTNTGTPLGYCGGGYFSVGSEDPLVAAAARAGNLRIGAILRSGQEILLAKSDDGMLCVPYAPDGAASHEGLVAALESQGLQCGPQTLYAVYDETSDGTSGVFYHGTFSGTYALGNEMMPINAIPFERIKNPAERRMLERYVKEFRHGSFGIYQGNQDTGTVHQITPVLGAGIVTPEKETSDVTRT